MATDMDIDMDLDIGPIDDFQESDITQHAVQAQPSLSTSSINIDASTPEEAQPTPNKVHLRGLDNLTSNDIRAFAAEYYNSGTIERIEWIDDTSANIIYSTDEIARDALTAFTADNVGDFSQYPILQMLPAKSFPARPDTRLEVRLAVVADKKQAGARDRSRFYLFNPEHDPAERKKREGGRGGRRYRERDEDGYRGHIYDDREHKRRQEEEIFDANLYDDDEAALALRAAARNRRDSRSSASSAEHRGQGIRKARSGKELFPNRAHERGNGRLRDRSASPMRDRGNSRALDDSLEARISRRARNERGSSANRLKANEIKARLQQSASGPKELFPQKSSANHRRSIAFDAADETADLLADRMPVPFYDGSSDVKPDLMSRISSSRLEDRISTAPDHSGISIKGSAKPHLTAGISIKGTASPSAKELFPSRFSGNAGKELFSDKLEGRGGRRRKAEDMFH